jgi:hypothetical protein
VFGAVSGDLAWWRAHRNSPDTDAAAMRERLERLRAWKARHDQERAGQFGFLQMAWDGVFGDEDEQVADAIRQLEEALAGS